MYVYKKVHHQIHNKYKKTVCKEVDGESETNKV